MFSVAGGSCSAVWRSHCSTGGGFSLSTIAAQGVQQEHKAMWSFQEAGSRAVKSSLLFVVGSSSAWVGFSRQGIVKAGAISLVAQEAKQARDISPKELKDGGLEEEGRLVALRSRLNQLGFKTRATLPLLLPGSCLCSNFSEEGHEAATCPQFRHAQHLIGQ